MKKMSFKEIVAQIQKMAVPPPPAPGQPPARPSAQPPTPGKSSPSGGTFMNATPAIREMQKAMQEFAQSAAPPPAKTGQPTADPNKPFNDFIAEQYLATSDIHGTEFSTVPTDVRREQKKPTDILEMQVVLDGLKRIGSQTSELKADALWDWRTNNALKNIYAFADALMRLTKDFGKTTAKSFNDRDLAQMKKYIPAEKNPKMSNQDKINRAKALTPLIDKLTDFYQYYVKAIATHPGYARFISGKLPYATFKPGGPDDRTLTDAEKKMDPSKNNISGSLFADSPLNVFYKGQPAGTNVGNLPLSVFQSLDTFNKQLQNQGYSANEITPAIQQAQLKSILTHINNVLTTHSAPEKPAAPAAPPAAPPPAAPPPAK